MLPTSSILALAFITSLKHYTAPYDYLQYTLLLYFSRVFAKKSPVIMGLLNHLLMEKQSRRMKYKALIKCIKSFFAIL